MSLSRRHMPPLGCLTAFETVARLGSVTDAARELDLTQSAVSRQIQKLETLVGCPLFERNRKRLYLTTNGTNYAQEIRAALAQISTATIALQANPDGGVLDLAILPSFGTHWLAPRLPGFLRAHPGITLNMSTRIVPFDFANENFSAAIHYGDGNWPGAGRLKLWDEQIVAAASPALLQSAPAADLPRLQLQTRPQAWAEWSKSHGLADPGRPAMIVDQFATMLRAALAGLGVALIPDYLVEQELDRGNLVVLPQTHPVSTGAYYLVWPEGTEHDPALSAFRTWLDEESRPIRVQALSR